MIAEGADVISHGLNHLSGRSAPREFFRNGPFLVIVSGIGKNGEGILPFYLQIIPPNPSHGIGPVGIGIVPGMDIGDMNEGDFLDGRLVAAGRPPILRHRPRLTKESCRQENQDKAETRKEPSETSFKAERRAKCKDIHRDLRHGGAWCYPFSGGEIDSACAADIW